MAVLWGRSTVLGLDIYAYCRGWTSACTTRPDRTVASDTTGRVRRRGWRRRQHTWSRRKRGSRQRPRNRSRRKLGWPQKPRCKSPKSPGNNWKPRTKGCANSCAPCNPASSAAYYGCDDSSLGLSFRAQKTQWRMGLLSSKYSSPPILPSGSCSIRRSSRAAKASSNSPSS